jgi:NAD(P)-dependent dehydrogenase (short-subunit alcohol dehydrogenase family)
VNRKALITAAASGIGCATAKAALAAGYEVFISDIDRGAGEQLAAETGMRFIFSDLAVEREIVNLIATVGRVDLLVNNGGVAGPTAPVTAISSEEWRRVIEINLTAQFVACREAVPLMAEGGGGTIINMASVAARIGYPHRSPYTASKWGVLGFTATLAREVGEMGIRVNAILPGAVRGPRIASVISDFARVNNLSIEDAERTYLQRHATGEFVAPQDIAAMIVFLASNAGRSITGQFICIDGGFQ